MVGWELEKRGKIVFTPRLLPFGYPRQPDDDGRHAAESEGFKEIIDAVYLKKIEMSDRVFVYNRDGYIGESTSREIEHAKKLGKFISYLEQEPPNAK